jgi:acetyl-CoA C-acetyltransferase
VAFSSHAKDPVWFTTAPADVIPRVLAKAGLTLEEIDLFEINEAFAVVTLAVNKILNLDPERVNVNGGAIALGHPIGASGARVLTTLLYAMQDRGKATGLATLCLGGGSAVALSVERF